jgi:hypothetical protein
MSKVWNFVKMDWKTIKPYIKGRVIWLYLFLLVFFAYTAKSSPAYTVSIGCILGYMFTSYPFAVGSKSNMDALYVTLGLKRRQVVVGRYLFSWLTELCAAAVGFLTTWIVSLILGRTFDLFVAAVMIGVLFPVVLIMQSMQLPIYFKVGYAKATLVTYLPIGLLAGLAALLPTVGKGFLSRLTILIETRTYLMIAAGIVFTILVVMISMVLSMKFYQKREF